MAGKRAKPVPDAAAAAPQPRPLSHRRPTALKRFHYGCAYYPEHWDEETRRLDPERMAAAGVNTVRMAEFAWDLMEPAEGTFDFSFFDAQIARLGAAGISTLLCTPTAAPPRWLTARHPGILRVDAAGVPMQHGSRQHACHANDIFRDYSRRITQAMADHFKDNPHVTGWQTDNELLCHFAECHCEACQQGFVEFLRRRYGNDVARLNQIWGTAFWAQSYERFEDVQTPRPGRPAYVNPAQQLDYYRFISATVTRFQHEQVKILRAANPSWWITHNGLFAHIDYRGEFTRDLDALGYDCYPMFENDPARRPAGQAFSLDRARAWSGNFVVPEQQAGPGGQPPYFHDTPEPGEMRKMACVSIARGADSLLFFRWRTCRFGAEEYWCGLLDHDNVPRRRHAEAAQLGRELKTLGPEVLGTSVAVAVAVAAADMEVQDSHATYGLGLPAPDAVAQTVHAAFYNLGYAVGCVHPADDLAGVRLYVVPHWAWFDPAWVPGLRRYVEAGGVLVIGARTATRDVHNNISPDPVPGCVRELAGVTVEEYGRQNQPEKRPLHLTFNCCEERVASSLWYEALVPDAGVEVLARWEGRHLSGQPAMTLRRLGRGCVIYVGTYFTAEIMASLAPRLVVQASLQKLWPAAPAGVEVVRRDGPGRRIWFFVNHADAGQVIPSTPVGVDLLSGATTGGSAIVLPPYGVAAIRETATD